MTTPLTYSNVPVVDPRDPVYYILDVGDLVRELSEHWHDIVAQEVLDHRDVAHDGAQQEVYPEVFTIHPVTGAVEKKVYLANHYMERTKPWHPDVSFILHHVLDVIKQSGEDEGGLDLRLQLLEHDISRLAHHQLAPNIPLGRLSEVYSDTRIKIARLAVEFGKKMHGRLVQFGLYKNGYFPYHFAGWQDDCALVELDTTHR